MSKELKVLHSDVKAKVDAKKSNDWFYSNTVKDHFFNPRNFLRDKHEVADYDGYGAVGSPACGDRLELWIKVDKKNDKIVDCKWSTFGCFKRGELVTSNPNFVKIENVKVGDKVFDHCGKETYV